MEHQPLILEIDALNAARMARSLPTDVLRVLRLFDGVRTLTDALDDSPLGPELTCEVVRRLTELGLIRPVRAEATPARLSPATWQWIGTADRRAAPEPMSLDEDSLEAALDAALGVPDASPDGVPQARLAEIPSAAEAPLRRSLQLYLGGEQWSGPAPAAPVELVQRVHRRLEQVQVKAIHPDGVVGEDDFTNLELAFFESYEPEEPIDEEFWNLLLEESPEPA